MDSESPGGQLIEGQRDSSASGASRLRPKWSRTAPAALVAATVALNLWRLRANLLPVAYLNDAAMHEEMVRYATSAFASGRDPLSGWFPYLNLGSPQFLHYQSLGAMITGAVGVVIGPDAAFRWSLFLLVGCWPVVIYCSARLFRLDGWSSAVAALIAPLIASVPQVGYEQGSYLWVGYGLWAQLWGSWMLPFAWATTWRATTDRRYIAAASVAVALTISLHYETGYLAIAPVVVFPFLGGRGLRARLTRASVVLVAAAAIAAWTLLPLLEFAPWAAINQALRGTPLENGYGARRMVGWLIDGGIFDGGAAPVLTALIGLGAFLSVLRWRTCRACRPILVMGMMSLILSFGRTTFGPLADAVPASHDIFFRRFMLGVQLAGIYLGGVAVVAACRAAISLTTRLGGWLGQFPDDEVARGRVVRRLRAGTMVSMACVTAVVLAPALAQTGVLDSRNAAAIGAQRRAEAQHGQEIAALVSYVKDHGDGRVYAGSPNNWGMEFTVGAVQVFKYLAALDVEEVGFTLRTASLMSQPEYHFDASNPADYALFGVRYLILPEGMASPVPANRIMHRGAYTLWVIPGDSYVSVVEPVGVVREDRADVGSQSVPFLDSALFSHHEDLVVRWDGRPVGGVTASRARGAIGPVGTVVSETPKLSYGSVEATVRLRRPGVVVLSASFDPGWTVTVDGRTARTLMLDPAVVGVAVPAGTHHVRFIYRGYRHYVALWIVAFLGLGFAAWCSFGQRRFRSRRRA